MIKCCQNNFIFLQHQSYPVILQAYSVHRMMSFEFFDVFDLC